MTEEFKERVTEHFLGGWNCQTAIGLSATGLWYTFLEDLPNAPTKSYTKTKIYHSSLWRVIKIHAAFCGKGFSWCCLQYLKTKIHISSHKKRLNRELNSKKTLSKTMQVAVDSLSNNLREGITTTPMWYWYPDRSKLEGKDEPDSNK